MHSFARPLVSPQWLHANPKTVVLDGTWHMPFLKRNALAEFEQRRIKGARFFDIDAIADKSTALPHMLPSEAVFAEHVGAMGISNDSHVVIYDAAQSIGAAARVLWTFRCFGHNSVSVLEGGLQKWERDGFEVVGGKLGSVEGEPYPIEPKKYIPKLNKNLVKTFEQMRANLDAPNKQLVVDARPAGRFLGIEPEPRAGLSSGHMPNSVSLPSSKVLDGTNGLLRGKDLAKALADAGVNISAPSIHSCGSGVNASVTWVAEILARSEIKSGSWEELEDGLSVYDGSWTEWAARVSDGAKIEK
ncbi:threonyl-tRNA synthetase [Podochytrium sp. JEL0797]|nr:threonyl-tRNA synthetase [Podochytrium sp. JEL0797]